MKPVKKYCNPGLEIEGILLTRYSARSVLSREVADMLEELAAKLGTKLFKTKIREAIAVKEAQISQQSLFEYSPKAKPTEKFAPGDIVEHMSFGRGEVISVKEMGSDTLYEIIFDKVGTKKLMATYARLKKVSM